MRLRWNLNHPPLELALVSKGNKYTTTILTGDMSNILNQGNCQSLKRENRPYIVRKCRSRFKVATRTQ